MKSKLILLGTVAGLSIISAANSNAHNQGWYVGIEAGANWIGDNDFAFSDSNDWYSEEDSLAAVNMGWGNTSTMSFDTGWAALGTVGYGFEKNWRVEFEVGYRSNDVDAYFGGKACAPRPREPDQPPALPRPQRRIRRMVLHGQRRL
jgi:OOP family OmpA-OmpF porin